MSIRGQRITENDRKRVLFPPLLKIFGAIILSSRSLCHSQTKEMRGLHRFSKKTASVPGFQSYTLFQNKTENEVSV